MPLWSVIEQRPLSLSPTQAQAVAEADEGWITVILGGFSSTSPLGTFSNKHEDNDRLYIL